MSNLEDSTYQAMAGEWLGHYRVPLGAGAEVVTLLGSETHFGARGFQAGMPILLAIVKTL